MKCPARQLDLAKDTASFLRDMVVLDGSHLGERASFVYIIVKNKSN